MRSRSSADPPRPRTHGVLPIIPRQPCAPFRGTDGLGLYGSMGKGSMSRLCDLEQGRRRVRAKASGAWKERPGEVATDAGAGGVGSTRAPARHGGCPAGPSVLRSARLLGFLARRGRGVGGFLGGNRPSGRDPGHRWTEHRVRARRGDHRGRLGGTGRGHCVPSFLVGGGTPGRAAAGLAATCGGRFLSGGGPLRHRRT